MATVVDIFGTPHTYELTPPTQSPEVLIFVHGWLLSRTYWQPIIQQLAPDFQCLSYDLRGFGNSQSVCDGLLTRASFSKSLRSPTKDKFPNGSGTNTVTATLPASTHPTEVRHPYAPMAYAIDLIELLNRLNISNAWVIGHSLGGSIALWAADQCSERIRGVICINSGGGIYLKEEFERFRAAGEQLVKLRPRWLCHLPLVDLLLTRMNVARPLSRQWGRQRLFDLVTAHPDAALGALLDSTTEEEVHCLPQVVARLQKPVYFMAGAQDTIMEPQYVRHLASFHYLFQCHGENVTEITNCGHLAMVEQPKLVADQIRNILSKH